MPWQWGERHDAAFGLVAPPDLSSAGSRKGGIRAGPDAIAPPGRLSAAMSKAQSKEPHLRERQRPRACGKQGKRGLSRPQLPARPTRCRVASACGAPKRMQLPARPTRCRVASACGAPKRIMPHPQERIARCAGQSASPAPLHLSRSPVGQADVWRTADCCWIET